VLLNHSLALLILTSLGQPWIGENFVNTPGCNYAN